MYTNRARRSSHRNAILDEAAAPCEEPCAAARTGGQDRLLTAARALLPRIGHSRMRRLHI
jgi:hypothetical protein